MKPHSKKAITRRLFTRIKKQCLYRYSLSSTLFRSHSSVWRSTIRFYLTRQSKSSTLQTSYYNVTINLNLNLIIKVQTIMFSTTSLSSQQSLQKSALACPFLKSRGTSRNLRVASGRLGTNFWLLCLQDISMNTISPMYFYDSFSSRTEWTLPVVLLPSQKGVCFVISNQSS